MKFYVSTSAFLSMLNSLKFDSITHTLLCKFDSNRLIFQDTKFNRYNYSVSIIQADSTFNGCIEMTLPVFLKTLDVDYPALVECVNNTWYISGKATLGKSDIRYLCCSNNEDKSIMYLPIDTSDADVYSCSDILNMQSSIRSVCGQLEKNQMKNPSISFSDGRVSICSPDIIYVQSCAFAEGKHFLITYDAYNTLCKFLSENKSDTFYCKIENSYLSVACGLAETLIICTDELKLPFSTPNIEPLTLNISQVKASVDTLQKFLPNLMCTLYATDKDLQLGAIAGTLQYMPIDNNFLYAMRVTYVQVLLLCSVFKKVSTVYLRIQGNTLFFSDGYTELWFSCMITRGGNNVT